MQYEWDEAKRRVTVEKHGEDFADADRLDWSRAHIEPDTRHDYGEPRYNALVPRDDAASCVWFSPPAGEGCDHQLPQGKQPGEKKL